ncbi:hypothetical protein MMC11_000211 [Xylographa trunciseda]|nr:hypothetical protein [Xylographa trunciseda]
MSSFLAKIRSNAVSGDTSLPKLHTVCFTSSNPATSSSPAKKDANQPQPTPLEKLLQEAGPLRNDGSDKFFGMENFGNTCYCNSILQCLYYSVPFRDQVINYPRRSPLESINLTPAGLPRLTTSGLPNGQSALSPTKPKVPPGPTSARSAGVPANPQKPEDKDSPEYKKKQAMLTGPILPMNYDNAASYGMTESLFTSLKDIFEAIIANSSRTGVVSPAKFLEVLRKENEMFRTSMHQDAHEFLNLLLNEVVANVETNSKKLEASKEMNGSAEHGGFEKALAAAMPNTTGTRTPSNTGWVHELFEGTLTSETKCLTCENVSQRDEAFLDLSVDLDQHSSVTSCLRKFSEEEMLCERNKFHCDRCGGLQEAEKRMKIKRLPKILALHLKRFKYTEDLQRLQKLFHRVVYPYHLRLFNTTDDAEDPDRLYELYAVVVHIGGGPYHGHYVSIVKTQDRGWLLFDDEMVEPVDKSYVRNFFGERPGLACAYVLFYQETTLEAVKKEQEAEGLAAAAEAIPIHTTKETPNLSTKTNGTPINGTPHMPHTAFSPSSPVATEPDHWTTLDRSTTLPPLSPTQTASTVPVPPITPIATIAPIASAPVASMPESAPKKPDAPISKKERAKEEKERKAAEVRAKNQEKEREKAEKARQKNLEIKRKESEKQQAADIKAAIEASKTSKAAEDKRMGSSDTAGLVVGTAENGTPVSAAAAAAASPSSPAPALSSGTLSRFRQTSKSISKRPMPKFWGSKDDKALKDEGSAVEDGDAEHATAPEKAERKNRFSGLRKKTSAMLS